MKFERKADFGPFGPFWGSKMTLFWAKNAFFGIFLDFLVSFCLNLAKIYKK